MTGTTPESAAPQRLLIFGSCVSRDALEFAPGAFELVDYYARSSMASLACAPLSRPIAIDQLQSPFQKRMVQRDIAKKFLSAVKQARFDVLLLDLIDERFSVYAGPDGGCTISTELHKCEPHMARWAGKVLRPGTSDFMALWEDGWQVFVRALRECDGLRKVRVNGVFWSTARRGGGPFAPRHGPAQIAAANAMMRTMYERMRRDLQEDQFLWFPPEVLVAAEGHKWGPSPYHYVDDYYRELMRRLVASAPASTLKAA